MCDHHTTLCICLDGNNYVYDHVAVVVAIIHTKIHTYIHTHILFNTHKPNLHICYLFEVVVVVVHQKILCLLSIEMRLPHRIVWCAFYLKIHAIHHRRENHFLSQNLDMTSFSSNLHNYQYFVLP